MRLLLWLALTAGGAGAATAACPTQMSEAQVAGWGPAIAADRDSDGKVLESAHVPRGLTMFGKPVPYAVAEYDFNGRLASVAYRFGSEFTMSSQSIRDFTRAYGSRADCDDLGCETSRLGGTRVGSLKMAELGGFGNMGDDLSGPGTARIEADKARGRDGEEAIFLLCRYVSKAE